MQVSLSNDRRVYNLSAGKSLPQWISDKKRRKLEQKDIDIRRRIQLMQDCEMPSVSHTTCFTKDEKYLFATGSYKPVLKCFELSELSLKFERGIDADVIKLLPLSDDDAKFVLLEEDRFVEFHTMSGRYHRLRVPAFGRDMAFCREISELYVAGSKGEVFRINLEEGRFMEPLKCAAKSLNCCQFNDYHQLFVVGTNKGQVEAWDYRDKSRVAVLDCTLNNGILLELDDASEVAEVTSLEFKGPLNLGVGLSSGNILLYDLRASKPYFAKDHKMGLPIKKINFVPESDLVMSMDSRVLKVWNELDGSPFVAIEPGNELNDFCRYSNSGLMFFANDSTKLLQYFVPSLGPAPKWCSYLESITDELEETSQPAVYDDYKFVTKTMLEEIGLSHLIGTSMLRAYMHGYFVDVRLYEQARTLTQPLAFENYKKRKLQEYIEDERKIKLINPDTFKLPKVNKELASRLQAELKIHGGAQETSRNGAKKKVAGNLLADERFKTLFEDPEFEVDPESEQFKNMLPKLKKLEEKKQRKVSASSKASLRDEIVRKRSKNSSMKTAYEEDEDDEMGNDEVFDDDELMM